MDHRELVSLELDDGWEGVEAEVRQLKALKEGYVTGLRSQRSLQRTRLFIGES